MRIETIKVSKFYLGFIIITLDHRPFCLSLQNALAGFSGKNFYTGKVRKDTMNCPEKAMKISHFNPNQSAPSIYIMIELCYFSLDQ